MNPKISIIVPVYNAEHYIHQCIDSILAQTFTDFELILVNDGSQDNSGSICNEYGKVDGRIRVLHKENGGQSSARNLGLNNATGDYIGFVDSDDWIDQEMYLSLINPAILMNADIVACNLMVMKPNGSFRKYHEEALDITFTKDEAMRELYKNEILTFSPCNKIYRREVFQGQRFKEESILEDLDISYIIIFKANKILYIKDALYFYRFNNKSTMRSEFSEKRLDEYIVRKEMYIFYKEHYPEVSALVYYEFCKINSHLYSLARMNLKIKGAKYKYLIKYDRIILRKLLKQGILSPKDRIRIFLMLYLPQIEILLKIIKNRTELVYQN